MSFEYSENTLVQAGSLNLLGELGWKTFYAENGEILAAEGTDVPGWIGRSSYHEAVLAPAVKRALRRNNLWLTEEGAEAAVKTLLAVNAADSPLATNRAKYAMVRDGVPVDVKRPDGTRETRRAKVIDFRNPGANEFLAVREFKIWGEMYHRRADLIGFVNGLPLLFVELKKQSVDVEEGYRENYRDYQNTVPQLFHFNAFVMLSNGVEAKVGTLGSPWVFFHEWKRLREKDEGKVDLETMLRGIAKPENLLDLVENFILFDDAEGKTAKIMAQNHQYLGVNEAVEAYRQRKLNEGKLGVFWHTQGSGKSYSMIFFTEKIRRTIGGSPTFAVLTDRDELNRQISERFASCGCLGGTKAERCVATSGLDLLAKLKGHGAYIFSLIQKFNRQDMPPIRPDHPVVLVSDEAHRTQNGVFAENMCAVLPDAMRIGFTGTPLMKYDNITERTFGRYVSIYDFQRAVDDHATVPLYYENRGALLRIENPAIDEEMCEVIERADLDPDQEAKLESNLKQAYHVLTAEKRLRVIAKDFVEHYTGLWTVGKAMFVCIDKVTTVRMWQYAREYWAEKTKELEKNLSRHRNSDGTALTDQEAQEMEAKLAWMQRTEMAVVVSEAQNDPETYAKWGLDFAPHHRKMANRDLEEEFKDPANPFRVVFVCAMWLTGFDVQCLGVMYFDKPLKSLTLMQAIARANRVCDGKANGLILDYVGIVEALKKALAEYTAWKGRGGEGPAIDKQKLLERIVRLLDQIKKFMSGKGFALEDLLHEKETFLKLKLLKDAADLMSATTETKKTFEAMARELFRLFKFIEMDELREERPAKNAISEIYAMMQTKTRDADITELTIELHRIVEKHIGVEKADKASEVIDISSIDFSRLQEEFKKVQHQHLCFNDIAAEIGAKIEKMLKLNTRRIGFYEEYQRIIQEYNAAQDKEAIERAFAELLALTRNLSEEENRHIREGFDTDEELAMFDLLTGSARLTPPQVRQLKGLAKSLLEKIKTRIREMDSWTKKTATCADIQVLIRDTLYAELPDALMDDEAELQSRIYEFVYRNFAA